MIRLTRFLAEEEAARVEAEKRDQQNQDRLNAKVARLLAELPSKANAHYDLGTFALVSDTRVERGNRGHGVRVILATSADGQSCGFQGHPGAINWASRTNPREFEALLDYLLGEDVPEPQGFTPPPPPPPISHP